MGLGSKGAGGTAVLLALAVGQDGTGEVARPFHDPAPPQVRELEPRQAPAPKPYPELRFHRPPRALAADAVTQDWPCFLGPQRDGHSRETRLTVDWGAQGPPLVWEMTRGQGYSSPVVQGERLIFHHRVGAEMHLDCLQAETGQRFWRLTRPTEFRGRYVSNNGPRSTPTISDGRVYVHDVANQLLCVDLATGRLVWQRDLAREFELPDDFFGVVSSPLVHGDLLVVNLGVPGGPSVGAFDKHNGALVWGAGRKWGASCASPVAARVHERWKILVLAGGESRPPTGGLMVMDAETGALDVAYPFRSRTYESVSAATPVLAGSRVFITASYGTGTAALDLAAAGGFEEVWKNRHFGLQFSNPVYFDDHLYAIDGISDRAGAIVCLDPDTGEELARTNLDWEESLVVRGARRLQGFSVGEGSLLRVDGRFLCLGDGGHLMWLDASPEGATVLARTWLFKANETWCPPVVSRGLLYVCQNTRERFGGEPPRLLCYDLRASQ